MGNLATTLAQLPYDYEVVLKPKGGTVHYTDTAGRWLDDDGRAHRLDDFELVTQIRMPESGGVLPPHLRYYQPGDIGGHIPDPDQRTRIGPIGEWVNRIEPETEASTASLGAGILAALGAWLGRDVTLRIGRIEHRPNILAVQVGYTGKARKGTADSEIRRFLKLVDPAFAVTNVISGFGSGEALIQRIADPTYKGEERVSGTDDQRLYIQEGEFSKILRIADRQGSILSDVIRLLYDGTHIANITKGSKATSSFNCVSLFGGITPDELVSLFPMLAATSGTGNRYLWVWSNPDKLLPDGGQDVDLRDIARAISSAPSRGRALDRTPGAVDWWNDKYPIYREALHAPETIRPITTRATDQILRIALIYAATAGAQAVDVHHLEAGEAWVQHSADTVQAILGGLVRNPDAAKILAAIRSHPMTPATTREVHDLFSRHSTSSAINAAIAELEKAGLAYTFEGPSTGGRPPSLIVATTPVETKVRKGLSSLASLNDRSDSLFAQDTQNRPNGLEDIEKNRSEQSHDTRSERNKFDPNANEVSPGTRGFDNLPDPF